MIDPGLSDRDEATPLLRVLRQRIQRSADQMMPVSDYMTACVAQYYGGGDVLGRDGDFITAPEISQIFGELIGLWCAVTWQQMGSPTVWHLVELGPGRGTMMRDVLRALRVVPSCRAAAHVHLIEPSEALRAEQRRTLVDWDGPLDWPRGMADVPAGPAIVLGNEYIDALAIEQAEWREGRWRQRCIGLDAVGEPRFVPGGEIDMAALDTDVRATFERLRPEVRDGDVFEWRPVSDDVRALEQRVSRGLAVLLIDYGHAQSALGDTLQAVRRHRFVPPLSAPGAADLTSQVDFELLRVHLERCGLRVDGTVSQGEFLSRLGIAERASRLMHANPADANGIEMAVSRLLSLSGMGARFLVLGASSPDLALLPGFTP